MATTFISIFKNLTDPRIERKKLYPLEEVIFVAFATILAGGESYTDMEDFGSAKLDLLREFFPFKNGIPSEDTYSRVFELISPKEFQECFAQWVTTIKTMDERVIAIDGKTLCGSASPANKIKPIHLVHAWAGSNRMTLGFKKVDEKSNEITAIPELLKMLSLKDTMVSIDAMGCQVAIANQIVDQGGDFVISLKGNQGSLHDAVKTFFELDGKNNEIERILGEAEKHHGRIERREYGFYANINWLKKECPQWKMLKSIGFVTATRTIGSRVTKETRYMISSSKDSNKIANASRMHWGVENSLHWVLDVVFNEDNSRVRAKNAAENLALLRRAALNVVTLDTKTKRSKRLKRLRAGWDDVYLKKALIQQF